ncbi:MAG: insulinase family protein [Bernardetiaceae bacterium]|nr:insulinase family protein [Bernardetiaceae bacterium]
MIAYSKFTLDNGLRVVVHEDDSVEVVVLNLMYDVGSRDEQEDKTGFAHLFEHLMFGGSKNIPIFDKPLERVGGNNNAFTSPDVTNYYTVVPYQNIETAFWLESDRMLSLSFDPRVLEVQRSVVIEEFKQMYLNQPYGDIWLKLRPLAYEKHPYKWATIGKEISHIEQATMEDVKSFFFKHYRPNNAVLVVAGKVKQTQVRALAEKWFGEIPAGKPYVRNLPKENTTMPKPRFLRVEADVPLDAIYKAYLMPSQLDPDFTATDLLSDVLGNGESSRLHQKLVKEQELFNNISAYITGSFDEGLLMIAGKLNEDVSVEQGNKAIEELIFELQTKGISKEELEKVQNQAEATDLFSQVQVLNRAIGLAYATVLGDTEIVNQNIQRIRSVKLSQMQRLARQVLKADNCATLFYCRKTQ